MRMDTHRITIRGEWGNLMRMDAHFITIRGDWGHLFQGQSMMWGRVTFFAPPSPVKRTTRAPSYGESSVILLHPPPP